MDRLQEKAVDLGHLERDSGRESRCSRIRQLKAMEWAEKASKRPKCIFNMSRQERGLTGYNKYGKKAGCVCVLKS